MWTLVAAVAAATPTLSDLRSDAGWTDLGARSSDVGDVRVRRKVVDGVACLEGALTTDAPVPALVGVADDMVSSIRWSSSPVAVSEELSRDATSFVLFQYFDTPGWTMSADRFWVVRGAAATLADGSGRYTWERVDAGTDVPDVLRRARERATNAVEPPVNFGEWTFVPSRTGTDVRYRGCADFGGSVPHGIQTWLNTSQVPALVADLVAEARRRA